MNWSRGSVSVLTILVLPVLLASSAFAVDVGLMAWLRGTAQAAADLGALAGVQEIDVVRLARGERWINEGAAMARAKEVALENLTRNVKTLDPSREVVVKTRVFNLPDGEAAVHPGNGRVLKDPTVCVTIEVSTRLPFLSLVRRNVAVVVHADASVVQKSR